ncbi:alpha-()-fucosyltransferase 11 [Lichtheimia corymbifera JMRC:FSU:9682]|uniref:Fucosyltransferase n=1 Tax=Lichtheimia corymbifera JMRC:FSU:9682 TaxID=1263082 RepID=A0A068RIK8_9FUNG|nr:alpha-()-fucosyltransferase 11 [Lichtheimia corymbifera JMRC:FSU:9682]
MSLPPISIVYWTPFFTQPYNDGTNLDVSCTKPPDLDIESDSWCTVTSNRSLVNDAAAIVFHAFDYNDNDVPDHAVGQPWILMTMESPINPPFRRDEAKMHTFEYLASYNLQSRFFMGYYSPNILNAVNQPPPDMSSKTGDSPVLWIASNCDAWSGRHHYVRELMKYINIDSYGTCLNNKAFPDNVSRDELMGQYKFYLAIENSNCDDYVTEKLFDTFQSSTVPIVDGPPSYDSFLPNPRSAIRMDAYPDPRELADYLHYLDQNDTAYLEYFNYRNQDMELQQRVSEPFLNQWGDWERFNNKSGWCGICRGVASWWQARHNTTTMDYPRDIGQYLRTDRSCIPEGKWDYVRQGPPYIPHWKPTLPDEFTRPWIKKRLPIYQQPGGLGDGSGGMSIRTMWGVYSLLYILFFVFVAMLLYTKRRRHQ